MTHGDRPFSCEDPEELDPWDRSACCERCHSAEHAIVGTGQAADGPCAFDLGEAKVRACCSAALDVAGSGRGPLLRSTLPSSQAPKRRRRRWIEGGL